MAVRLSLSAQEVIRGGNSSVECLLAKEKVEGPIPFRRSIAALILFVLCI